jgi:hypothetical protein
MNSVLFLGFPDPEPTGLLMSAIAEEGQEVYSVNTVELG